VLLFDSSLFFLCYLSAVLCCRNLLLRDTYTHTHSHTLCYYILFRSLCCSVADIFRVCMCQRLFCTPAEWLFQRAGVCVALLGVNCRAGTLTSLFSVDDQLCLFVRRTPLRAVARARTDSPLCDFDNVCVRLLGGGWLILLF